MLIGGRNGTIYEAVLDAEEDFFKSQERYLQPVFTLPERHPVTGLKFDMFPPLDPKQALVLVTTATRIYQFVGIPDRRSEEGGRVFSALFGSYRDTVPSEYMPTPDASHTPPDIPKRLWNFLAIWTSPSYMSIARTPIRPTLCRGL